jgi:predicted  nucleic acid-binding Zn-ribbon protein
MATFNGKIGDLVSHVMVVGCPKCGRKDNFQATVANRIIDQSTPVETIEELGLGNWSITCGNPKCGYKISKLEEIFRDEN